MCTVSCRCFIMFIHRKAVSLELSTLTPKLIFWLILLILILVGYMNNFSCHPPFLFFFFFYFLFLIFICSQLKDPHCYFSTVVSNMSFLSARSIFSIFPHSYLFTICHFHDSITLVSHNSACDLYYLDPLLQNCCLASYSPYMFVCALPLSYLSVNICSCSY